MPFQGVGNVQTTKYGFRVRVRVGYKDIYGPYRRTVDCARLDLAKLHGEHGNSERKKAVLLQLKSEIGLRRGGRKRSDGVPEVAAVNVASCSAGRGATLGLGAVTAGKGEQRM